MKWVTNWSNAISIVDHKPEGYAKDITLRYPILSAFDGNKIRISLDNYTGCEKVHIEKVTIAKTVNEQDIDKTTIQAITFSSHKSVNIEAGKKVVSDEIEFITHKNEAFSISIYLSEFTSMQAGVTTSGPLTKGFYSLKDQSETALLPINTSKEIAWYYFLSDVDIYCQDENESILCFGDSITAQAWPEYLQLQLMEYNKSVARKAVSGARILREYTCLQYEPYGLKGITRFPYDLDISGCDKVIVLQGVNDIIHPVGTDVNPFRPMSDFPDYEKLIDGYRFYIRTAHEKGMKIYLATILPIKGWRTYAPFREELRTKVNQWIRTTDEIDGYIDFADKMKNPLDPDALLCEYDSGDHLHPSIKGHKKMAEIAIEELKKYEVL